MINEDDEYLRLITFEPGTFVELDDPMTGKRRLVLVCSSGTEFVDYIDYDAPATPFAILDVFDPVAWGDGAAIGVELLLEGKLAQHEKFSAFYLALCDTGAGGDVLTLNRAIKWAFEKQNFELDNVAAAGAFGLAATKEARSRHLVISLKATAWIADGVV